ncbi:MAG: alpha/beta hydrolase-fold protein [Planctomycetota bacterium]
MSHTRYFILAAAIIAAAGSVAGEEHAWSQPPTRNQLKATPGWVHRTIQSEFMPSVMGYSVVLPPGYDSETDRRYPVVYWLHGGGGNECSDVWNSRIWGKLSGEGEIGEVILVYPNAGRSSYWDHHDGKVRMESFIVHELIPEVDATFRTDARRQARAVHGFSMGASGALKFAIKYPELFCSAVAYGGGAIDLETTQDAFVKRFVQRNLNSDPELIRKNNTYRMLRENQDRLRKRGVRFLLICGNEDAWKASAVTFHEELRGSGLDCECLLLPGVGHEIGKLMQAKGRTAALFQDDIFRSVSQN